MIQPRHNPLSSMTLTQLAYAVALDRYRHFGRAAEHCHVSQPTLSMQLQKLEEELGVQLFDRSKKPILPTPAGKRILQQARLILSACERLKELAHEDLRTLRGELKIGIIPTLSPYLLPLTTRALHQQYPHLRIHIEELTTRQILEALVDDRLDAGLIATEENQPGIKQKKLFQEPFVAYFHPEHPLLQHTQIEPAQLTLKDLWLLSEGHCFREQVLQVCGQRQDTGPASQLQFESGHLETLRLMVDTLGGLTLLPYLATLFLPPSTQRQIRHFTSPVPSRTIYLIHTRQQLKAALLAAYMHTLKQTVLPLLPHTSL